MDNIFLRILIVLLLVVCSLPSNSAADAVPDAAAKDAVTGFTAEQALAIGAVYFVDAYTSKTHDYSTTGMADAWLAYARLRRYVNDRAVLKRTKTEQQVIGQARTLCMAIAHAFVDIEEAAGGGGSVRIVQRAGIRSDVETAIGKVILAMEQPQANAKGRIRADTMLRKLIAHLDALPKASIDDPEKAKQWQQQRTQALTRLRADLPRLRHFLKSVPDGGALALARFAAHADSIAQTS